MISALSVRAAGLALQLLLSIAIAKALGQSGFGLWASVLALSTVMSGLATFGLPPLMSRDLARDRSSEKTALLLRGHARAGTLLLIPASALLFVLSAGAMHPMSAALAGCALLVPLVIAQFRQSAAIVFMPASKALAPEQVIAPVLTLVFVGASGGFSGRSLSAIVAAYAAGAIIASFVGSIGLMRRGAASVEQTRLSARRLLTEAVPFFLAQFPRTLFANADILIIGSMLGASEAGAYALAARVAALASLPLFAVITVCQPLFAAQLGAETPSATHDLATASAFASFTGGLLASGALLVLGPSILSLAGDGFPAHPGVFHLLVAAHFANSAFGPNGMALLMSGHERTAAAGAWLQSILSIGLTAVFGLSGNLFAAAAGVSIAMVAANVLMSVLLYRRTGIVMHPFANSRQRALSRQMVLR